MPSNDPNKIDMLHAQDEATKHLSMAEAILDSMICEGHHQCISSETLGRLIWAASDHVERAREANEKLWQSARKKI